jgi:endonuclease/exonuclease/phosphatase family metal-dependent hydrolase
MTFNLRYASPTPPHAWHERRPVTVELIQQHAPDVIGTQEGLYQQLKDLAADLPQYEWIGLGREGGSRGEFMAVFFRSERLEPLEYDHFWLSDTPDIIGSASWGNTVRRMVTWVKFRDRAGGGAFYFFNTHFDHQSQPSREKSAELTRTRVESLMTDLPIILVGDFNAAAENNNVYSILVGTDRFEDTWQTAKDRGPQVATFHNYRGPVPNGMRIDWILARGAVRALSSEIVTFAKEGQYPSDHFPVVATLELGAR